MSDEMPDLSGRLNIDVESALSRAKQHWSVHTTHTEDEAAFLDRFVLAAEVLILRQELADTQDALAEAEREVDSLEAGPPEPF